MKQLDLSQIEGVFAYNCRELRNGRPQAKIAELAKLPMRTYARCEDGRTIPDKPTRLALCRAFECEEPRLFQDPNLAPKLNLERALRDIRDAFNDEATFEAIAAILRGREKFLRRKD